MLMQKEADISVKIIIPGTPPPDPQTETEVPEEDNEPTRRRHRKPKPAWAWLPIKKKAEGTEKVEYPVYQGVIQHDWQGVLYLMLDLLDKFKVAFARIVEAAIETNKLNLARSLIRKNPDQLTTSNESGQNLIHILAINSNKCSSTDISKLLGLLFDAGVSLVAKDKHGCTPLHYACLRNNYNIIKFISEHVKKDLNVMARDVLGRTPIDSLFWNSGATMSGNVLKLIYNILGPRGAKFDVLCDYPVDTTMPTFGHSIPTNQWKYHGPGCHPKTSPLLVAIYHSNYNLAKTLLQTGIASVNFADENGLTPLMYAVKQNNPHVVQLLFDHDYDKNKEETAAGVKGKLKKKHSRRVFNIFNTGEVNNDEGEEDEDEGEEEEDMEVEEEGSTDRGKSGLKGAYKQSTVKSALDLNVKDSKGWTALHHLVSPLPLGTYDNAELLRLLVNAGANATARDNSGKTPVDLANRQAPKLNKMFGKLLGTTVKKFKPSSMYEEDGISWEKPVPDFKADAETLLRELEKEDPEDDSVPQPTPDDQLGLGENEAQVVYDDEGSLYYDVLLTKIDVQQGPYGLYNFYKMQIIYQKAKELHVLFTRWGRIGDSGQYQRTPFPKKEDCVKEFLKVFKAKTGNAWKDIASFENKPKKYRLVQADQRTKGKKLQDVKWDLTTKLPSKLPLYVKDFMQEVTDVTGLSATIGRMGLDSSLMPLGRIRKDALQNAKTLLTKIQKLVKSVTKRREKNPIEDMDAYTKEIEEICTLSSDYYHLVPQSGFEFERLRPLDSEESVQEQLSHIDRLLELAIASRMLAGAQYRINEMNPLDYIYRSMGVHIKLLEETDLEAQYLLKYVVSSSTVRVAAIFRVSRPGEEKQLEDTNLEHQRLLFHGSSSGNLISILSRGLLVAPPDVDATGYAFGKGVYTADRFSKSEAYCYNWSDLMTFEKRYRFMLVAQVALGRMKEYRDSVYMEKPARGYSSTLGVGGSYPDSAHDITLPTGAILPLGKTVDRPVPPGAGYYFHRRSDNEYIVYDEKQVALRYIIQYSY